MSNTVIRKKVGSTTYTVNVYFTKDAAETMEEKILRVISHYPLANGEKCDILNISQMSRLA